VAASHIEDLQASNRAEQVQQGPGGWIAMESKPSM
jgi:hypothetical protein